MLLLCSATLHVYDSEVGYNLYVDQQTGKYFFKPTLYENRNLYPPSFWLEQKGANWEFDGITDRSLKDQAIEELSYCLNYNSGQAPDMQDAGNNSAV